MLGRRWLAAVVVSAGCALVALPASATTSVRHCSGGFDDAGRPSRTDDVWRAIQANGTSCRRAVAATQAFVVRTHDDPGSLLGRTVHIGGFRCRQVTRQGRDNPYGFVTCTAHGGARVTFIAAG